MYIGPDIIKSGLVLYLDAANTKSYPTTGTLWTDLSGNNNNGTLTNGPTFDSGNGGSIVFDGTNDYVPINNGASVPSLSTNNLTVELWFLPKNDTGQLIRNRTFGYAISQASTSMTVSWFPTSNVAQGVSRSTTITLNVITNIAFTFGTSTLSLYINGSLISSIGAVSDTLYAPEKRISLGRDADSNADYLNTQIYNCKIYNRALSATEVLQNFNATKSRFNL